MNAKEKATHIVQSRIEGYQITRHPWSEGMIAAIERAIIEAIEEDRKTRECCKAEREACAQIAEEQADEQDRGANVPERWMAQEIERLIRARSES
jgi:hypothetical protein